MTSADPAYLSTLLVSASRRVRNDGRLELQSALAGAPFRPVDVGPLADLLFVAATAVEGFEDRGWDETKILSRLDDTVRYAVALARAIVQPNPVR